MSPTTKKTDETPAPGSPEAVHGDTPDPRTGDEAVADEKQNAKLEHSEGGVTTRDDRTDLGVPMLPGSPDEPQGPEDALGEGPKRGDYTNRMGGSAYQPHEGAVPQKPRAEDIGDVEGKKGGVETSDAAK